MYFNSLSFFLRLPQGITNVGSGFGKVAEITQQGAAAHINKMAKKYLGKDKYPFAQPGEQRVLYKIEPEKIHTMG